jgi:hypothetical protein
MAAPLFVLALAWNRLGATGRARLRGGEIQIGPIRRHSSVLASSVLFILLGLAFMAFQGGNAFGAAYDALGAADLALAIETWVRDLAIRAPLLLVTVVGVPVAVGVMVAVRAGRRARAAHGVVE